MNISKSKIKTLENCPLCFKWQYLEYKKPDTPPAAVTRIGLDVHDIFNKFYDVIKIDEIGDQPLEYFKNSMEILPQYREIFNLFCNFQASRWNNTTDKTTFIPVIKERKFINKDEVGVVDAVHYDCNTGEYMILDYKSGVSNPTNLRFELNYYAKIVNDANVLDKPVKYIGAYGYKTGEIFCEDIKIRSYNLMLQKIADFRAKKFETMEFPKKIGFACNWCSYLPSCNKL